MKKKLLYLLLALTMCAALTACGGGGNTVSTDSGSTSTSTPASTPSSADELTGGPTDAQLSDLTDAYNQVATLYNDVATTAQANGWTDDQETVDALKTISAMMEPVGLALAGDMSALDGANFDVLPGALLELLPDLEALAEKVATPYEDGDAADEGSEGAMTEEEIQLLAETYNEIAPLFNDAYVTAEANGWLADEQTAAELQALTGVLTVIEAGLAEDPSMLEDVDINALIEQLQQFVPALGELSERVSVPYEG